jgi:L,D-transpeptidase catalytic domain
MVREVAVLGAAMMALWAACPDAQGASVTAADSRHHRVSSSLRAEAAPRKGARRRVVQAIAEISREQVRPVTTDRLPAPAIETADGAPTSLAYHAGPATVETSAVPVSDTPAKLTHKSSTPAGETSAAELASEVPAAPGTPPVLSDQEVEVGQIANAQGDKTFLMVDKALGKIILFENGQPVFAGPALTGQSTADQMPKTELTEKFDTLNAPNTKITPAGRYTVERGYDKEVGGPLFDIHEIRGKDWGIAIHEVYLGIPSEHRDARIMSPREEDKHITFGCINVTPAAIRFLLHELPVKGPTPLYILPEDARQDTAYFTPHTSS